MLSANYVRDTGCQETNAAQPEAPAWCIILNLFLRAKRVLGETAPHNCVNVTHSRVLMVDCFRKTLRIPVSILDPIPHTLFLSFEILPHPDTLADA